MLFLQVAHLEQAEVRPRGAAGLAGRSFLGGLLPESLLYALQTGGPGAFAAALAGDADTPELIWTHRMRGQRLVPQACAASTRFQWPKPKLGSPPGPCGASVTSGRELKYCTLRAGLAIGTGVVVPSCHPVVANVRLQGAAGMQSFCDINLRHRFPLHCRC